MPGIEKAIHAEILKALRKHPQITRLEKQVSALTKLVKKQGNALTKARVPSPRRGPTASPSPEGWRVDSVRTTRHKLGISQGAMAKLLGASLNSVSGWETGRTEPRLKTKEKVLDLREISTDKVEAALKKARVSSSRKRTGKKPTARKGKSPTRGTGKATRRRAKSASVRPARRSSGKRKAA